MKTGSRPAYNETNTIFRYSYLSGAVALLASALSTSVMAIQIPVGNSDLKIDWDNTFRYNAGWRAESQNSDFLDSPFYDDTENKFDRGDMVMNRLDVLSELDVVWKRAHAVRVSAAAWYDDVYQDGAAPHSDLIG